MIKSMYVCMFVSMKHFRVGAVCVVECMHDFTCLDLNAGKSRAVTRVCHSSCIVPY